MRSPRYQLLADHLIQGITSGQVPVGGRIPSEHELCKAHSMSRGTVRQALRCLEDLGMITRSPMGTIVTATHPVDAYHPSAIAPNEIMDLVQKTKLRRPKSAEVFADEELAARLDVGVGSHWYSLVGPLVLRSDPDVVLCWSEHYHSTVEGRKRLRHGDFTVTGVESLRLEQVVSAELMNVEPARALGTLPGSAALIVRRTHIDGSGNLIKVSLHTHRGDCYKIRSVYPHEISVSLHESTSTDPLTEACYQ
jgi:GntR family transcriptional regulator